MKYDIFSLVVLALFLWRGYASGAIKGLTHILGWVIAIIAAVYIWQNVDILPDDIMGMIGLDISSTESLFVVIVLTVIVVRIAVGIIMRLIATFIHKTPVLGKADKFIGLLIGALKAIVLLMVLTAALTHMTDLISAIGGLLDGSQMVNIYHAFMKGLTSSGGLTNLWS